MHTHVLTLGLQARKAPPIPCPPHQANRGSPRGIHHVRGRRISYADPYQPGMEDRVDGVRTLISSSIYVCKYPSASFSERRDVTSSWCGRAPSGIYYPISHIYPSFTQIGTPIHARPRTPLLYPISSLDKHLVDPVSARLGGLPDFLGGFGESIARLGCTDVVEDMACRR